MTYYIETKDSNGTTETSEADFEVFSEAVEFVLYEGDEMCRFNGYCLWVVGCYQTFEDIRIDRTKELKAACFAEWEKTRYEPPQIILDLVEEEWTKESGEWDLIDGDPCIAHDNRLTFGDVM